MDLGSSASNSNPGQAVVAMSRQVGTEESLSHALRALKDGTSGWENRQKSELENP